MEVLETRSYDLDVFQANSIWDDHNLLVDSELGDDEATENRVEVRIIDFTQQDFRLSVKVYREGNVEESQTFQIVDSVRNVCRTRGQTDLSTLSRELIWGVYLTGYVIENLETFEQNFIDLKETLQLGHILNKSKEEWEHNSLMLKLLGQASETIDAVSLLLMYREVLDSDQYTDFFHSFVVDEIGLSEGDDVNEELARVAMYIYDFACAHEDEFGVRDLFSESVNADENGKFSDPTISARTTLTHNGTEYEYISLFNRRGAERYDFQKTGADRCVFQRRTGCVRPPTEATFPLLHEGIRPTNIPVLTSDQSLRDHLKEGVKLVRSLQQTYGAPEGLWAFDIIAWQAISSLRHVYFVLQIRDEIGADTFDEYYSAIEDQLVFETVDDIDTLMVIKQLQNRLSPDTRTALHENVIKRDDEPIRVSETTLKSLNL